MKDAIGNEVETGGYLIFSRDGKVIIGEVGALNESVAVVGNLMPKQFKITRCSSAPEITEMSVTASQAKQSLFVRKGAGNAKKSYFSLAHERYALRKK